MLPPRSLMRLLVASVVGASASVAAATPLAYVTNLDDRSISVVDLATATVIDTIVVGDSPLGVVADAGSSRVYVTTGYRDLARPGTLVVLDMETRSIVARIPVGVAPFGMTLSPDGRTAYVTNNGQGVGTTVTVVDTRTLQSIATIPVGLGPVSAATNSSGTRLYVVNANGNSISIVDTATNLVIRELPAQIYGGADIVMDQRSRLAYIASPQTSAVFVMDLASETIVSSILVGQQPTGLALLPDGSKLYVSTGTTGALHTVTVIDTASRIAIRTIAVGANPFGLAVDEFGTRLVVANSGLAQITSGDTVSLIDTSTDAVLATVPVGHSPAAFGRFVGPGLVISAGADQVVDEGTAVILHGAAAGPVGVSYSWEQVAGPTVTLSDAFTLSPSFVAPWLPGGVGGSQTLTFTLTVSANGVSSTATVNVTVKNTDHAPVAVAGLRQTVNEGSSVTLDGSKSYDPEADPIACSWVQTVGDPVSLLKANACVATFTAPMIPGGYGGSVTLGFALTVSDTQLTGQSTTTVTVEQVNHSPVAVAGPNQTVNELTVAKLNGSSSSDPDGDPFTYAWTQLSGPVVTLANPTSATPSFTAPEIGPGGASLVFQLVMTDGGGLSSTPSTTTVTVQDVNDPPLCELGEASPSIIWPPNHKMVPVSIVGVTDPQSDKVTITVTGITQDEPVNGTGDGDTGPDGSLMGSKALIRAERAGSGNGRVYQMRFTADDGDGGVCKGAVRVGVPHDAKDVPVDNGQQYDSTKP